MKHLPDKAVVLVVDDEESLLRSVSAILVKAGLSEPALLSESRLLKDVMNDHPYPVVILDLMMPPPDGMELLAWIKEHHPTTECLILTGMDDVSTAVRAVKLGAYDYLVKLVDREKLVLTISRALEKYDLGRKIDLLASQPGFEDLANPEAFREMVARDEKMAMVFNLAEAAAPTDYNVLITGESGTGKELLAKIIHEQSRRSKGPFIAINMASLSPTLFESEFYGHIKGSYTGALGDKKGFFEAADGGSLFLDEITELESNLQAKLLRIIQEKKVIPIGSTRPVRVDTRVIAATNRPIREDMKNGLFRPDLFYRLNTCNIHIPPLRKRKKDILPLALFFLEKHAAVTGRRINGISTHAENALLAYEFPGNVRELENIIAAAVLIEKGGELTYPSISSLFPPSESENVLPDALLSLAEMTKHHILMVLDMAGDNRIRAAEILGIGVRTLYRKLKEYNETKFYG